jgi:hypothetical protein
MQCYRRPTGRSVPIPTAKKNPVLIVSPIAPSRIPSGPIWILELILDAKSAVPRKRGHALLERVKTAIRSAPFATAVLGTPRSGLRFISA